jgi:integrase
MNAISVQRKMKIGASGSSSPSPGRTGSSIGLTSSITANTSRQRRVRFTSIGSKARSASVAQSVPPREAKSALALQLHTVTLRDQGVEADDAPQIADRRRETSAGKTIVVAIDGIKKNPPPNLRPKSIRAYNDAFRAYLLWTKKTSISEIDRNELLDFMSHLIHKERLSPATTRKHGRIIHILCRRNGNTITIERGEWPKPVDKERTVYESEELQTLWTKATPDEYAVYQTFLLSGFRNLEVAFLAWPDFNPKKKTLSVKAKPDLHFAPKDYEERTVSIPDKLVDILLAHKDKQPKGSYLIAQA